MKTKLRAVNMILTVMALACMLAGFVIPFGLTRYAAKSARMAVDLARYPGRFEDADQQTTAIDSYLTRVDLYISMEAYACMFFGLVAGVSIFAAAHMWNKE